jgi:PDZ domain/Caspase domain
MGWCRPSRAATSLLVLLSLTLFGSARTALGEAPNEAKRLRALLVVDSNDPRIGAAVKIDGKMLKQTLEGGFAREKDRLEVTLLEGANTTEKNIFDYYENLAEDPDAVLLFFYSGHGANDPKSGNYLQMPGGDLLRSKIRAKMLSKKARAIILLTNVCNVHYPITPRPGKELTPQWETQRCLLLQHRGVVDLNAASEGEFAWNSDTGIFSLQLNRLFCTELKDLDTNKDGFLHWQEALPWLQAETQTKFLEVKKASLDWYKNTATPDEQKGYKDTAKQLEAQLAQTVRAYSLPPSWRFGARVIEEKDGARIVEVVADTPAALAGLQPGDVIRSINGKDIKGVRDLSEAVAASKAEMSVTYKRTANQKNLKVTLAPWASTGKDLE